VRHALILAGGSGTRLWPMSTASRPKQLIPVLHGRSLLDIAIDRARRAVDADRIWLGVGRNVAAALAGQTAVVDPRRVVVEPAGRDTLPAIGLGVAAIAAADPDAVVAVLTADHVIEPIEAFTATLATAYELAEARSDALVTFGVEPDHPATGFGYLELADALDATAARRVSTFREKPDLHTAESYVAAGPQRYLWNSGMFVWSAATFLSALDTFCADDAPALRRLGAAFGTAGYDDLAAQLWPAVRTRSVDYAVMEPASTSTQFAVLALPLATRWLDVGSWPPLGDALGRDDEGNATTGRVLVTDATNCTVVSSDDERLVTVMGCRDLVVIATPTALLVVPADQAQRVKDLQALVAERFPELG
jgi:mannose-1-phosphate guanylyltransferase